MNNIIKKESDRAKRDVIELFLLENQWHIAKTARELGIDNGNLHRFIRKYQLKRPQGMRVIKY